MEDGPGEKTFTTATTQHLVPVAFYPSMHALQGAEVPTYTIVGIVSTEHSIEVDHLFPDRQMPHASHQLVKFRQAPMEPRLLGPKAHLEIALVVTRAIEGEAQEINSLRAFPPSLGRVTLSKAAEFDEFGLGWCQFQSESSQPLAEDLLNADGIRAVLETEHKIINVAHHVGFPCEMGLYHPLKPEVEHIVKVDIAQQYTDRSTLWRPLLIVMDLTSGFFSKRTCPRHCPYSSSLLSRS